MKKVEGFKIFFKYFALTAAFMAVFTVIPVILIYSFVTLLGVVSPLTLIIAYFVILLSILSFLFIYFNHSKKYLTTRKHSDKIKFD